VAQGERRGPPVRPRTRTGLTRVNKAKVDVGSSPPLDLVSASRSGRRPSS
jgi:hypothetical protein